MYGVFKKLTANDIKITPFEAHKQYFITNFASSGIVTSSALWSIGEKSTFSSENIKYYQIDKLFYRNFIQERANRLEINDAPYKKQERRLYDTASIISIAQGTFGNEIQPTSLVISSSKKLYDDGFGNLYDSSLEKENFPDEDNRVLYLGLVNGFKLEDLSIDPNTGNTKVNYTSSFYGKLVDDSYFNNEITYTNINFERSSDNKFYNFSLNNKLSLIEIENRPYLNFDDSDFTINFNYQVDINLYTLLYLGGTGLSNSESTLLYKGGPTIQYITPTDDSLSINQFKYVQDNGKYPYKIYTKYKYPTNTSASIFFEKSDGINTTIVSGALFDGTTIPLSDKIINVSCQKSGSQLNLYVNGILQGTAVDNTEYCGNKSNITLYGERNNEGILINRPVTESNFNGGQLSQLMMWDSALTSDQIIKVSESITGTYPVGNIFYDNGFAVITHPNYQDTLSNLNSVSYKNTYPITEYEYQCTVSEQEYNYTSNLSVRKVPTIENDEYKPFITGSNFKPYVTTIGLYDDNNNLLAVGKLGQPIKMTDETDTTFVIRFDT